MKKHLSIARRKDFLKKKWSLWLFRSLLSFLESYYSNKKNNFFKKNSTVYVLFQFIPYKTFCSITFNDALTYECHYFLFNLTLHWDIKNFFFLLLNSVCCEASYYILAIYRVIRIEKRKFDPFNIYFSNA